MTTTELLSRKALRYVTFNGERCITDSNVQMLLGVLLMLPGLKTTGSCGGHPVKNDKWPECSQPEGKWFVSFRCGKLMLAVLEAFAKTMPNVRFAEGPHNTLPVCGVCENRLGEPKWWGLWGEGDAEAVAERLYTYIKALPLTKRAA